MMRPGDVPTEDLAKAIDTIETLLLPLLHDVHNPEDIFDHYLVGKNHTDELERMTALTLALFTLLADVTNDEVPCGYLHHMHEAYRGELARRN